MKEQVLKVLLEHGILIEPDAVDYILSMKDPVEFVKDYLDGRKDLPLFIGLEDVRLTGSVLDFNEEAEDLTVPAPSKELQQSLEHEEHAPEPPEAITNGEPLKIFMDITGNSTCDGSIDNFTNYFRDRFKVLRRLIRARADMGGLIKIDRAKNFDRDVRVIGMLNEVRRTKNGHLSLTIEDDTDSIFVLIPKNSELQNEVILKDEVIGIVGRMGGQKGGKRNSDPMLIPKKIVRPEVPVNRIPKRSKEDIEVVFLSDTHVGSSHFLPEPWERFGDWLGQPEASKIQYAVVTGDLVDGIGIYPNQEDELDITNIVDQYSKFARMLDDVPKNITLILQPGNHDAVRPAEPQPALPERFQEPFGKNVRFIGNPSYFSIGDVEILSYHGRSIDDLVGTIPGIKYQTPNKAMLEMLKRRHLLVSYGSKTPIAPETKDYMVINPVPDIFVTGHVHRTSVERYRGITLINASAWQSQTPFQVMHNFHPDPGKVIVVNLKTGRCRIKDFT